MRALLASADVFFHNVNLAGMERLGFGYEAARACARTSSTCTAPATAPTAPTRARQALDDLVQGADGLRRSVDDP